MKVEATAPGKMLLTGEYAVLLDAPAVAMAIGGPARATVQPSANACLLSGGQRFAYSLENSELAWKDRDPGDAGRLPTAVLLACHRRWPEADLAMAIELDTSAFQAIGPDGRSAKLGLGSSAALVVALVGGIAAAIDLQVDAHELRDCCLAAHRAFQGQRGSGVDVLAAFGGGLQLCRQMGGQPRAATIAWPDALHLLPVWTGKAASTPALIARFDAFRARDPAAFENCLNALRERAELAAAAWQRGDADRVMRTVRDYGEATRKLDRAGDVGIWTDEHRELAALADSTGAVYKPSGAGGGDLGFFLSTPKPLTDAASADIRRRGFQLLEAPAESAGLQVRAIQ